MRIFHLLESVLNLELTPVGKNDLLIGSRVVARRQQSLTEALLGQACMSRGLAYTNLTMIELKVIVALVGLH